MDELNEGHRRHLLSRCRHADKLLSDIEAILDASRSKSPFPKYQPDVAPAQVQMIRSYLARLREQLVRVLAGQGIQPAPPRFSALHSIRVNLAFARVAIAEMEPRHLRGYGEVPARIATELRGLAGELDHLVQQLDSYLEQGVGADLAGRIERLDRPAGADTARVLKRLEEIIAAHGLVEFRPALRAIVERLETERFEIAVFGRVNSGKSSLLNHILRSAVLPVGVRPITSVPTHLVYGAEARLRVTFAGGRRERTGADRLAEFVSEERNPGNEKGVTAILVEVPSERLADGVAFVDTPGLGSLATAGAEETLAYLPRCDLGIVLVNAAATLNEEDLATIRTLYEAAIPVQVLLSKADLVSGAERQSALDYITGAVRTALGVEPTVHPVSIVGSQATLLEQWFAGEIAPLYARRRELARRSIARKTAALREAVESALRRGLERAAGAPENPEEAPRLARLESELRRAQGRIGEVLDEGIRLADHLRRLAPRAIEQAAAAAGEPPILPGDPAAGALRAAIERSVSGVTGQVLRLVRELAAETDAAVARVEAALDIEPPAREEPALRLRELPRIDLSAVEFSLPAARLFPGRAPGRKRILAHLKKSVGAALENAFAAYGRVLEAWVREAVGAVENRFESRAEPCRARLAAALGPARISPEEAAAIRADLETLAAFSPERQLAGREKQ